MNRNIFFLAFVAFVVLLAAHNVQSRSAIDSVVDLIAQEPEYRHSEDIPWEQFLFFGGAAPTPVSPSDPKVIAVTQFAVSQYNDRSAQKTVDKVVVIKSAKAAKEEFYYVTFDLGVTTCPKPNAHPDSCPLDPHEKVKTCSDVIIWVRDYKEHKMQVTSFANCKP